MDAINLCWTGDVDYPSFKDILSDSDNVVSLVPLERLAAGKVEPAPDVIVLAQTCRGQFDQAWVERIWTHYPLAPIVNLLSSECEGDLRAGTALRGVVRVFWYQWHGAWAHFSKQWHDTGCSDWHQPRTARLVDRLLSAGGTALDAEAADGKSALGVVVWAPDVDSLESLEEAVSFSGCCPIRIDGQFQPIGKVAKVAQPFFAVCLDVSGVEGHVEDVLQRMRASFGDAPTVVIIGFPRPQDQRRLAAHGVAQVLGKPFDRDEFAASLSALVHRSGAMSARSRSVA